MKLLAVLALALTACVDYSPARLRTAVDAQRPVLDQCYEGALQQNPSTAGRMKLLLHIPTGANQVDGVRFGITDRGVAQAQLQQCIANALVGLPIGASTAGDLQVEYTLSFEPES